MAVWVKQVSDGVWVQLNISNYQLINNACVLNVLIDKSVYDELEVRVADQPNELVSSPSDISIVAGIANEVEIVAGIADEVVIVADMADELSNFFAWNEFYIATQGQTKVSTTQGQIISKGMVYINGSKQTENVNYVSADNGLSIVFNTPLDLDDEVSITGGANVAVTEPINQITKTIFPKSFVGDFEFVCSQLITTGVNVYLNGVLLANTEYTYNLYTVTLLTPTDVGDEVVIVNGIILL